MSISQDEVINYLSNLSVIDLVNLTKALEDKWGVKGFHRGDDNGGVMEEKSGLGRMLKIPPAQAGEFVTSFRSNLWESY